MANEPFTSARTAIQSRSEYRFRSSQGTTPGGTGDPGSPLYMPTLVPPGGPAGLGERQAVFTTAYNYFIDYAPDAAYDLNQNPNADAVLFTHQEVAYCRNKISMNVVRQPESWHAGVDPRIPEKERQEMCSVAQATWESIPNIMHLYDLMLKSIVEGGIGIEFIWGRDDDHVWRPKHFFPVHKTQFVRNNAGYLFLVTRETIPFGAGIAGNPYTLPGELPDKSAKLVPLAGLPGKWLYHCHRYDTGPYYRSADWGFMYWGRGEGNSLYRIVTVDNSVLDLRLKLLQTFAIPPLLFYYPDRAESIRQFQNILSSMRKQSVIRLPRRANADYDGQYKVDSLHHEMGSYDALDNFYRLWTRPAVRSIMLLDESGGDGGMSFSERSEANETGFDAVIDWNCKNICNTINNQFVPAMIRAYPQWSRMPITALPRLLKASERVRHRMNLIELYSRTAENVPLPADIFYKASGVTPTPEIAKLMSQPVYHDKSAVDAEPVDPSATAETDEQDRLDHAGAEPKNRHEARKIRPGINDAQKKNEVARERKKFALAQSLADYYAIPPQRRNGR